MSTDPLRALYPPPRRIERLTGSCPLGAALALDMPPDWRGPLVTEIGALARRLHGQPDGATRVAVEAVPAAALPSEQAYTLAVAPQGVTLQAPGPEGVRYGLRTLGRLIEQGSPLPCCRIQDHPRMLMRGIQVDLGRVIERPETILRLLDLYAGFNYNVVQLYFENAFLFPSHPKLARPHAWTLEQSARVVEAAARYGIRCIPAIQALGHSGWVTAHPDYAELDESHEAGRTAGVLCPNHPRTLEMLGGMIRDVAPLATAGIIHVGMDEVFAIGQCSRCRPRREEVGEGGIYAGHANRVAALCRAVGKRPAIWGDMFYYYPEDVARLDRDLIIFDWYYYVFERLPRVELFNFREVDTQRLWRGHGLDSWGCPASLYSSSRPLNHPAEAFGNIASWARYLDEVGGRAVMVTQWELSPSCIDWAPALEGAAAGLLWNPDAQDAAGQLATACGILYQRPELAPLLSELGERRFHGHCSRHWLHAKTVGDMATYTASPEDVRQAERMDALAARVAELAHGARNGDMVLNHEPAARWLAYQFRKRHTLDEAANRVAAADFGGAADRLAALELEARRLADLHQGLWNKNRYPDDPATTPQRLREEARLFAEEQTSLRSAAGGRPYAGGLGMTVIQIEVINSHPAIPCLKVSVSPDSAAFTPRGTFYILEFHSHAARPVSDDRLTYTVSVDAPEHARYIRVTALGDGQFTLCGVRMRRGGATWIPCRARGEGRVEAPERLLSGGTVRMGHPDPRALYYELMKDGNSGRIFSVEHGSITLEMSPA